MDLSIDDDIEMFTVVSLFEYGLARLKGNGPAQGSHLQNYVFAQIPEKFTLLEDLDDTFNFHGVDMPAPL
jgi:hypothetical protein